MGKLKQYDSNDFFFLVCTDGVDEERGCMGGLMACSLPPSKTYTAKDDGFRKDYAFEFRGRGGSLWSQTTSTMVGLEPADLLPSPTDSTAQGRRELPLYARGASSVPTGARRPRNLFLRGTNFLYGEDVTSPQDHSLAGPSLDMDLRGAGRRQGLFFNFHQPVIHEVPPRPRQADEKYLDMSVREYMNMLPASSRTLDHVEGGNAKLVEVKDAGSSSSSYLPMSGVREGQVKVDTTVSSAAVAGSGAKAAGTGESGATVYTSLETSQHLQAKLADDHLALRSGSGFGDSESDTNKDTVEDGTSMTELKDNESTRRGRDGNVQVERTPTRRPETQSLEDKAAELPQ